MKAWCPITEGESEVTELCHLSFGSIVRCETCGLVRYYPPRTPEQLASIHADRSYFQHPYFEARRDLKRDQLRAKQCDLLNWVAQGASLQGKHYLDIGCDTGTLLVTAKEEFGMAVSGVEVSEYAAQVASSQYGLHVWVGQLSDLDLPPDSFDIITMLDVIEHLSDPVEFLRTIWRLLRPNGKLYIITADHDALINRMGLLLYRTVGTRARYLLEHLYIPYHEYYFTRPTLAKLVEQAGFRIQQHRSREFPLDEFGHGVLLKSGLAMMFVLQKLFKRQTLQEILAVKLPERD